MKVPLLEYLDKLEATAKVSIAEAGPNTWESSREDEDFVTINAAASTAVGATLIAKSVHANDAAHILATQPKATLALIAKLRELAILARRAREASTGSTISWRELDEALTIEVPE